MTWSSYQVGMTIIGPVVMVTNLPVVVTAGLLVRSGVEPRATYMILGNIALADFTTSCLLIVGAFYPDNYRTNQTCSLFLGSIVMCSMCSMLNVCLLAVERFIYIVHGMEYCKWVRCEMVVLTLLGSWGLSVFFGLLPIVIWPQYGEDIASQCFVIDGYPPEAVESLFAIVLLVMLVVVVLYSFIYRAARNAAKSSPQEVKLKVKSVVVVCLSATACCVTWSPFVFGTFIYATTCKVERCETLLYLITDPLPLLGVFNSVLNPLIYAWWHRPFKDAVKKLVCRSTFREELRIAVVGSPT